VGLIQIVDVAIKSETMPVPARKHGSADPVRGQENPEIGTAQTDRLRVREKRGDWSSRHGAKT